MRLHLQQAKAEKLTMLKREADAGRAQDSRRVGHQGARPKRKGAVRLPRHASAMPAS
jgi:hypothetical protein